MNVKIDITPSTQVTDISAVLSVGAALAVAGVPVSGSENGGNAVITFYYTHPKTHVKQEYSNNTLILATSVTNCA